MEETEGPGFWEARRARREGREEAVAPTTTILEPAPQPLSRGALARLAEAELERLLRAMIEGRGEGAELLERTLDVLAELEHRRSLRVVG